MTTIDAMETTEVKVDIYADYSEMYPWLLIPALVMLFIYVILAQYEIPDDSMTFFRTEMLFFIWAVPLLLLVILYGMRRRHEILHRFCIRITASGRYRSGKCQPPTVDKRGAAYGHGALNRSGPGRSPIWLSLAGDSSARCGHHYCAGLLALHDGCRHSA
jgi:hypothetical protein